MTFGIAKDLQIAHPAPQHSPIESSYFRSFTESFTHFCSSETGLRSTNTRCTCELFVDLAGYQSCILASPPFPKHCHHVVPEFHWRSSILVLPYHPFLRMVVDGWIRIRIVRCKSLETITASYPYHPCIWRWIHWACGMLAAGLLSTMGLVNSWKTG